MKVKAAHSNAVLPRHFPPESKNVDMFVGEDCVFEPHQRKAVTTSVHVKLEPGTRLQLVAHPAQQERGLVPTGGGVVDPTLQRPMDVIMSNLSGDRVELRTGDVLLRCLVLNSNGSPIFDEIDEL